MRWFTLLKLRLRAALLLVEILLRLKRCSLPRLLIKLTPEPPPSESPSSSRFTPTDVQRAVDCFVFRPPFRWRPFPRTCLLRSLALYHLLRQEGHEAQFSLGVARLESGRRLEAHSRVLLDERPFAEREDEQGRFHEIYCFPPLDSSISPS